MTYVTAAAAGFAVGIGDIFLLFWAQKREDLMILHRKKIYRQKPVWFLTLGMTAVSVYFMGMIGSWNYLFGAELLICGYLLPLCVTDWMFRILPDTFHLVYGAVFAGFKVCLGTGYDFWNGCAAALCVLVFLGAVSLAKRDQLGMGDIKLLCVCGFLTGFPAIAWLFFRGLAAAGIYSAVQMLRRKADLKTEFPFVPFLLIGVLI